MPLVSLSPFLSIWYWYVATFGGEDYAPSSFYTRFTNRSRALLYATTLEIVLRREAFNLPTPCREPQLGHQKTTRTQIGDYDSEMSTATVRFDIPTDTAKANSGKKETFADDVEAEMTPEPEVFLPPTANEGRRVDAFTTTRG